MAYPPFYSSFTPPFYSFHHQPGVINFTHLCSPCPTLRPQSPSHHLHYSLAPYSFNCIDTVTVTTPQISQTSFHQLPTLTNSTNLNHSFSYQQYQDPIPPPDLPSLQTNIEPLFLVPPVKRDDEGKSQARITGSKFSTIADEKNFSDIANFSTPDQSVAVAQVVKGEDEETVKSQDLIAAKAKSQAAEPHQDPPSNFRVTPQFTSFTRTQPSLPSSLDGVPTVRFSGSKNRLDFAFITPDLLHPTCFELGKFLSATSLSPAKTKGNTIFVFDPGGISPCYEFSSAIVPPPQYSIFVFRSRQISPLYRPSCSSSHLCHCAPHPSPEASQRSIALSIKNRVCNFCSSLLGSIAATSGFEWASSLYVSDWVPFLIGPNPVQ